ncbi:hypothetical protein AVEN_88939-1 [Araneus ventricosus]|uniref:Uncharacterized protein n=1 Tax=Araneus ventricosus TaxID=182803 RepID=A0A4Y2KPB8_ARAVE|nr:hypothetical protein AVEN_88939-1 [Araneus ventricosus]
MALACPLPVIVRASYGRGRSVIGDGCRTRPIAAIVTQMQRTASRQALRKLSALSQHRRISGRGVCLGEKNSSNHPQIEQYDSWKGSGCTCWRRRRRDVSGYVVLQSECVRSSYNRNNTMV